MAELYDVLNKIIENDKEEFDEEVRNETEIESDSEEKRDTDENDQNYGGDYDSGGLEGRVSNSVGRGAVENWIKNSVYDKYNIDSAAMKEFSRLSPTEMLSGFGDSVKELDALRADYARGVYS